MAAQPSQIHARSDAGAQTPPLRSDARNNRRRILEVAGEMFAALGTDVPMTEVARRAGVGVATLYRRFPTRDALIAEAFTEQVAECSGVIEEALADTDPWRGFCWVIEKVCTMQALDKGFTHAFLSAFPDTGVFEEQRAHAERGFAVLTQRAMKAGELRADFAQEDLALLLMANNGITAESPDTAVAASRRLVAYFLHAFRADHAGSGPALPPPAPLGLRDVFRPPNS